MVSPCQAMGPVQEESKDWKMIRGVHPAFCIYLPSPSEHAPAVPSMGLGMEHVKAQSHRQRGRRHRLDFSDYYRYQ